MISAILLAAGSSRRFGAPKLTEALHGRAVIRWSAEFLRREPVDEVIVVVPPEHVAIREALRDVDVHFIVNHSAGEGIGTSLAAGIRAVDSKAIAALVALGDTPMPGREVLRRVIERFHAGGCAIVVPRYNGTRGHPVIFARAVFPELMSLTQDEGARAVTERDPARVAYVDIAAPPPADVDTPEDLAQLRARMPRDRLLDELMPHYDVCAAFETVVDAPMHVVYQAVLETDLSRSLISRALVAIRSLGRRTVTSFSFGRLPARGPFFALGCDPPREVVAGIIGRFWEINGAVVDGDPALFQSALPKGFAKAAWSFHVDDNASGSRLSTETRVLCADDHARRRFLRYWTLVGPFSGIIRREALHLIRAQAQFTASSSLTTTPTP